MIDEKIIEAGAAYDFSNWYYALVLQGEVLERVKEDGAKVEEQVKGIQSKIFQMVADVLDRDIVRRKHLQSENLKDKVQEIFSVGPILKEKLRHTAS